MSYRELNNWYKYLSEEPTMSDRTEIQLAKINFYIASYMSDKNHKPKFEDFMIRKQKLNNNSFKPMNSKDVLNKLRNF